MRLLSHAIALSFCTFLTLTVAPAHAVFHNWRIKEIFSNSDGTVQFIEFFTTSGGEQFIANHALEANSDGVVKTYTFPNQDFAESTANKHFLLATAAFDALPNSPTPNFTPLPDNFINPNATSITLTFAHGADIATFAGSLLPKDGVNSLTDSILTFPVDSDSFTAGPNSPTNFAGVSGHVNASPLAAADFNSSGSVNAADLALWRIGFGKVGNAARIDGDADGDLDVDGADFLKWQQQTTNAGTAAPAVGVVPEPGAAALAVLAAWGAATVRSRLRE